MAPVSDSRASNNALSREVCFALVRIFSVSSRETLILLQARSMTLSCGVQTLPEQLTLAMQADGGFGVHRKPTRRDVFLAETDKIVP